RRGRCSSSTTTTASRGRASAPCTRRSSPSRWSRRSRSGWSAGRRTSPSARSPRGSSARTTSSTVTAPCSRTPRRSTPTATSSRSRAISRSRCGRSRSSSSRSRASRPRSPRTTCSPGSGHEPRRPDAGAVDRHPGHRGLPDVRRARRHRHRVGADHEPAPASHRRPCGTRGGRARRGGGQPHRAGRHAAHRVLGARGRGPGRRRRHGAGRERARAAMTGLRVAVGQLAATEDAVANAAAAAALLARAADEGARLVVLPEYTIAWAPRLHAGLAAEHRRFADTLAEAAARHGVLAVAGTLEPVGDRMRNVALAVGPDGTTIGRYTKVHLFDAFGVQESEVLDAGDPGDPVVLDVDGWRVGLATCYDLRFPESFRVLVDAGADVLAVGAAWAAGPGKPEQLRV